MSSEQFHLTFPDGVERERTVAMLRTSFPVHLNIRRANVEPEASWYIVELTGEGDRDRTRRRVAVGSGRARGPDPHRRIGSRAMHEIKIQIRWRDMDAYGHVNNAVYLNYLEDCRDAWAQGVLGGSPTRGTSCSRTWASTTAASSRRTTAR